MKRSICSTILFCAPMLSVACRNSEVPESRSSGSRSVAVAPAPASSKVTQSSGFSLNAETASSSTTSSASADKATTEKPSTEAVATEKGFETKTDESAYVKADGGGTWRPLVTSQGDYSYRYYDPKGQPTQDFGGGDLKEGTWNITRANDLEALKKPTQEQFMSYKGEGSWKTQFAENGKQVGPMIDYDGKNNKYVYPENYQWTRQYSGNGAGQPSTVISGNSNPFGWGGSGNISAQQGFYEGGVFKPSSNPRQQLSFSQFNTMQQQPNPWEWANSNIWSSSGFFPQQLGGGGTQPVINPSHSTDENYDY